MIRQSRERRLHPRLEQKLPLNVAVNGFDFATTTRNISCVGAYCRIDKYMPPFTKIAVKLSLPGKKPGEPHAIVECKGVVVRSEDESDGGFNIAIFFNQIGEQERKKISRYVSRFLP